MSELVITSSVVNSATVDYQCLFCKNTFTRKYRMEEHCAIQHPNEIKKTWLQCQKCQQYCIDSSALMRHTAKIHSVQIGNRVKCSFCIETFTQRSKMATHCKTQHPNDIKKTWLQCKICQQYSIDSCTLKIHTDRKHPLPNGNRTKCSFCIETFSQRNKMVVHCRQKHPNDIMKSWLQCEICQQYCIDTIYLKKHTEIKHDNTRRVPVPNDPNKNKYLDQVVSEYIDIKDEAIEVDQGDFEGSMKNSTLEYDSVNYCPYDKSLRKHEAVEFNQNIDIKDETMEVDEQYEVSDSEDCEPDDHVSDIAVNDKTIEYILS
jgi:Pyruvate/2-oxoacid:ferredoxin oxidoreductase delta subunit